MFVDAGGLGASSYDPSLAMSPWNIAHWGELLRSLWYLHEILGYARMRLFDFEFGT